MATPVATKEETGANITIHRWDLTTADHTGTPIELPMASDRTAQFNGTNWGGATAALEGSIDGTVFLPLTDPQANAIAKTTDGLETVMENTRYIRPRLTTAGTLAVVACWLMSRNQR